MSTPVRSVLGRGSERKRTIVVFTSVLAVALAFALVTQHAWEDYYITYRPSKNLATGHGLVFNPGERVHTFTSPINVLLPALLCAATGNLSDSLVLWLYRVISGCALGGAAVFLDRIARRRGLSAFATGFLLVLFSTDAKIVDFTVNGQEIGFMLLFLGLTLRALLLPSRSPSMVLGLGWAGLLWTRPDGFVYFGAIAIGVLAFNAADPEVARTRSELIKLFIRAVPVTTAVYLPWFLWAFWYYGSPVPNTVIAKGISAAPSYPGVLIKNLLLFPIHALTAESPLDVAFTPIYSNLGGWPRFFTAYSKYLAWCCAFFWLIPRARPHARAVSFAFMLSQMYLAQVASSAPWYIPSSAALGIYVLAQIVQAMLDVAGNLCNRWGRDHRGVRVFSLTVHAAAASALVLSVAVTLAVAYQLRIQQRLIEDGNRTKIGLWLRDHAASARDTVFLEPLGYIGFFSQLKTYDFPGMSSPEMVAARKRLQSDSWGRLIEELQPDWLVLRPFEAQRIASRKRGLLVMQTYTQAAVFDVSSQIAAYGWLPGRPYLVFDQTFVVYRRNAAPAGGRRSPGA